MRERTEEHDRHEIKKEARESGHVWWSHTRTQCKGSQQKSSLTFISKPYIGDGRCKVRVMHVIRCVAFRDSFLNLTTHSSSNLYLKLQNVCVE